MAGANEKAWVRLRRVEIRELAHQIGDHALRLNRIWPTSGEGRAVKAACERLIRRLEVAHVGSLPEMVKEFQYIDHELSTLSENLFFVTEIGGITPKDGRFKGRSLASFLESYSLLARKFISEKVSNVSESIPISPVTFSRIETLIPEQKFGPAKFFVHNGRLHLLHTQDHAANPNRLSLQMARDEIINISSSVEDEVRLSNADPRIAYAISDMRDRLVARQNIMQLGISSMAFDSLCDAAADELPALVSARLKGFSLALKSYVGQFKEWEQFCETAAAANMVEGDPEIIIQIATELAEKLEGTPTDLVDREIPKTLRMMTEAIGNPRKLFKARSVGRF